MFARRHETNTDASASLTGQRTPLRLFSKEMCNRERAIAIVGRRAKMPTSAEEERKSWGSPSFRVDLVISGSSPVGVAFRGGEAPRSVRGFFVRRACPTRATPLVRAAATSANCQAAPDDIGTMPANADITTTMNHGLVSYGIETIDVGMGGLVPRGDRGGSRSRRTGDRG